jgi:hypothetical protein
MDRERLRQLLRAVASASRRGILTRDGIEDIAAIAVFVRDGSPESGNWGHAGRPGQVGGSSPGGGEMEAFRTLMGEEFKGVRGDAAIEKLLAEKHGHVKEAFYRDDIGGIDIFWGNDSAGLQHIINERNKRGISGVKFVRNLGNVLRYGQQFKSKQPERLNIGYKGQVAVITFELYGTETTAVLTAFKTD